MKPDILILSSKFPNNPLTSEIWLANELLITNSFYNSITILPEENSGDYIALPQNCMVLKLKQDKIYKLTIKELINCLQIVLTDFSEYPSKIDYIKLFRYNFSLIKQLTLKAKRISDSLSNTSGKIIVYSYWADNLLTTACILKKEYKDCLVISRGHGFEIFEDQTRSGVIPFRKYQSKIADRIFAVSKRGCSHLKMRNKDQRLFDTSYIGTVDHGPGFFDKDATFTIVTCSVIRNVKRVQLMGEILKHLEIDLVWHILGDGEDLHLVKRMNQNLPSNIRVIYHGFLKNDAILKFYQNNSINLFVSLSASEGLPVSMMEAQSFGIPIMSTDVGGCNEICNEETGFLIERDFDPKQVAIKLNEFRNSNKNTLQFRKQCREHWKNNFDAANNYMNFSKKLAQL